MQHDPKLIVQWPSWQTLLGELRRRTDERQESGAFLLGQATELGREVEQVVYYDDLDPHACRAGAVVIHAASFGRLWDLCRSSGLTIVADIHVHPREAFQSVSDRENPMIGVPGHLALIVPFFARSPVALESLGFFEYRGSHRWRNLGGAKINQHLRITA